jgi:TRAP transporter 4TM/12TM fusion protein
LKAVVERLLAIAFSLILFYTAGFGEFTPEWQRVFPFVLVTILLVLLFPAGRGGWLSRCLDAAMVLAATVSMAYLIVFQEAIAERLGRTTTADLLISIAGTLVTLELTRRTSGPTLPLIALGSIAYAFVGPLLPGPLAHGGYSLDRTLRYVWLSSEGVFGLAVGVMASFVTIYILFGAFLERTGGGRLFIALADLFTGRLRSGPGQSTVLASALFGTMSGSGVADVAAVGTFCIPVMKRAGYSSQFSAAIQGLASIGAQIMPPVMGASAFIMAELTGTPYIRIAAMAVIPAVLYYACVGSAVYFESARLGLRPELDPEARRERWRVLRQTGVFLVPVAVLLYMLIGGASPARSAFWAIVATIAVSLLQAETRLGFGDVVEALESAARGSLMLWSACACVGIIISMVTMTGIGGKFAELVVALSGESLFLALVITLVASIILGTGLPTVPSYLLLAILVAPSLAKLGLPLLAAHFFIFFYGVTSDLSPPTALAPFTAAGVAGADPWKTTWLSCRIGLPVFIVPFLFVYSPSLLLLGTWTDTLRAFVPALAGCVVFAMGTIGFTWRHASLLDRAGLILASFFLISANLAGVLIGVILAAAVLGRHRLRPRSIGVEA